MYERDRFDHPHSRKRPPLSDDRNELSRNIQRGGAKRFTPTSSLNSSNSSQKATVEKEEEEAFDDIELFVQDDETKLMEERRQRRLEILQKYQLVTSLEKVASPSHQLEINLEHSPPPNPSTPTNETFIQPQSEPNRPSEQSEPNRPNEQSEQSRLNEQNEQNQYSSTPIASDMFSEECDLFLPQPDGPISFINSKNQQIATAVDTSIHHPGLSDNWDDPEGYYKVMLGELLDGRYHLYSMLGKGVFSLVVKARDTLQSPSVDSIVPMLKDVAIKIIRKNEVMFKAGLVELELLRKLQSADPEGEKHIIRLIDSFEHRSHLCMVFESMSMNLREVLKKVGGSGSRGGGLAIDTVRIYARQTFLALTLLKDCNIIHSDIKPDNMLVDETRNVLKLADLGSASDASEAAEITSYLVSRFYRAPEISLWLFTRSIHQIIVLGTEWGFGVDVWSVACTFFELFEGTILFTGASNNQMLKMMMEVKGRFPNKMLKRGRFSSKHFESSDGSSIEESTTNVVFKDVQFDRLSNQEIVRKWSPPQKPTHDLKSRLLPDSHKRSLLAKGVEGQRQLKLMLAFVDLLERCLHLNPDKRLTAHEALDHAFIVGDLK